MLSDTASIKKILVNGLVSNGRSLIQLQRDNQTRPDSIETKLDNSSRCLGLKQRLLVAEMELDALRSNSSLQTNDIKVIKKVEKYVSRCLSSKPEYLVSGLVFLERWRELRDRILIDNNASKETVIESVNHLFEKITSSIQNIAYKNKKSDENMLKAIDDLLKSGVQVENKVLELVTVNFEEELIIGIIKNYYVKLMPCLSMLETDIIQRSMIEKQETEIMNFVNVCCNSIINLSRRIGDDFINHVIRIILDLIIASLDTNNDGTTIFSQTFLIMHLIRVGEKIISRVSKLDMELKVSWKF